MQLDLPKVDMTEYDRWVEKTGIQCLLTYIQWLLGPGHITDKRHKTILINKKMVMHG